MSQEYTGDRGLEWYVVCVLDGVIVVSFLRKIHGPLIFHKFQNTTQSYQNWFFRRVHSSPQKTSVVGETMGRSPTATKKTERSSTHEVWGWGCVTRSRTWNRWGVYGCSPRRDCGLQKREYPPFPYRVETFSWGVFQVGRVRRIWLTTSTRITIPTKNGSRRVIYEVLSIRSPVIVEVESFSPWIKRPGVETRFRG